MNGTVHLPSLPAPLSWSVAPAAWELRDDALSATAAPQTDLFCNPDGSSPSLGAARLVCPIDGDFQLSARVGVEFGATFDAGALLVWRDAANWAKLCFEYSPQREPMVVSVVTRGRSDDANGFTHHAGTIFLRITRSGEAIAFHASVDGLVWKFVRHFALDLGSRPEVGFVAQSPSGPGVRVEFDQIAFGRQPLADLRSGA